MAKITAPQLKALMMLARAEATDQPVMATSIHNGTLVALIARDLVDYSESTGRVWIARAETSTALWAQHAEADDKRFRHESRCRACERGGECVRGDNLFYAVGNAFDVAEAFDNVFLPFTVEVEGPAGAWRPMLSDGRNVLHFATLTEAKLWLRPLRVTGQPSRVTRRVLRNGVVIPGDGTEVSRDTARAEHEALVHAQDADIAAGALTDATVERYGTANPSF